MRRTIQHSRGADLRAAIRTGLDEGFTSLVESFGDLSDDQTQAWPLERRHNIVTLVEHCIQALDQWACETQGRPLVFQPDLRFDIRRSRLVEDAREGLSAVPLPTVAEQLRRIEQLRGAVMGHLDGTSPDSLTAPVPNCWWYKDNPDRTRADAYLRAIYHNAAHVRQIWALRGLLGAVGEDEAWPAQHWA